MLAHSFPRIKAVQRRTRPRCGQRSRPPVLRCQTEVSSQSGELHGTASNVCKTCGVELGQAQKGCDGEGRILGGLGAVPGFGWWPIKAYRPCPALSQAGIEYIRKGQTTNETLFGGVSLGAPASKSLEQIKKQADRGLDVEL